MKTAKLVGNEDLLSDDEMQDIIINDIKKMDANKYISLIEFLYPVSAGYVQTAKCNDANAPFHISFLCIKSKNPELKLEDIF